VISDEGAINRAYCEVRIVSSPVVLASATFVEEGIAVIL